MAFVRTSKWDPRLRLLAQVGDKKFTASFKVLRPARVKRENRILESRTPAVGELLLLRSITTRDPTLHEDDNSAYDDGPGGVERIIPLDCTSTRPTQIAVKINGAQGSTHVHKYPEHSKTTFHSIA